MGLYLEKQFYTRAEVLKKIKEKLPVIIIDYPRGSLKGFGDDNNKVVLPFDYGEMPSYRNQCDGMGWDIVIAPSSNLHDELIPVGVMIVNTNFEEWLERLPDSKKIRDENPVGNDKIILAKHGVVTESDRQVLEAFVNELWQFEKIDWFD